MEKLIQDTIAQFDSYRKVIVGKDWTDNKLVQSLEKILQDIRFGSILKKLINLEQMLKIDDKVSEKKIESIEKALAVEEQSQV